MFKVTFKGKDAISNMWREHIKRDPFLWWKRPCWQSEQEANLGRIMEAALNGAQF